MGNNPDLENSEHSVEVTSSKSFIITENVIEVEESKDKLKNETKEEQNADEPLRRFITKDKILSVLTFCFANFCTGAFYSLPGPFFPQEATLKGLSTTRIGVVFSAYELVVILSTPLYGNFLTTLGAKFTYNTGLLVAGSCSLLFGFLDMVPPGNTFFVLALLIRTVEGLGIAALITASFAIIAHTFPTKATSMIASLELFTGLGLMVGPPIGGVLYHYGGFGTPFWTTGALLLTTGFFTIFSLPSQKFEEESPGSMTALLRIPLVTIAAFFVAICALCLGFLNVTLAVQLNSIYHFSPLIIGMIFLVGPGVYTLSVPCFGWLADKFPGYTKQVLLVGFLVNTVGFVCLGPAPFLHLPNDWLWLSLLSMFCFGFGTGSIVMSYKIINQLAIINGYKENLKTFGIISGIFNTFFPLGAFFGPILGGFLVDTLGFAWASFVISTFSALMCVVLLAYLLIDKLCRRWKSTQHTATGCAHEKTPLLSSK